MENEPGGVEFVADAPVTGTPVEVLDAGSIRRPPRWWAVGGGATLLVAAAAVIARSEYSSTPSASPSVARTTAPSTAPSQVTRLPEPVFSYSFDPGPEGAHTGSCIDCARFDELSPAAERAIRHAFPTGRVVSADSVLSSDTYRVLTRTARVLVGRNVVSIDVSVATGPAETSYTVGADRVTVSARVDGFRVVLRSIGPDVALPVLKSLAEDPRLVVA